MLEHGAASGRSICKCDKHKGKNVARRSDASEFRVHGRVMSAICGQVTHVPARPARRTPAALSNTPLPTAALHSAQEHSHATSISYAFVLAPSSEDRIKCISNSFTG